MTCKYMEQQLMSGVACGRSIKSVAERYSISTQTVYREIKRGRLKAKKLGKRTIITEEAEQAWVDSLPDALPGGLRR